MDKRDMEEDGKNKNRKGWGIEIKMIFLCREIKHIVVLTYYKIALETTYCLCPSLNVYLH
jgi:hypothetical protein